MNIKIRSIASIILSFCLFSLMASCVKDIEDTPANNNPENITDSNIEAESPDNSAEITDDEPDAEVVPVPEEPKFYNPLTGILCDESYLTKRPVAIMINNIKNAIPQHGITDADIIYECIVEGGITRLLGIYSDYEDLPTTGSVRSSRDYYIDIAQAHDAIYAHCGGSPDAYAAISQRKIDNIDGVNGSYAEAGAYWKDQNRVYTMGYEHASMTNGERLTKAISDMGFRTALTENFSHPLKFSSEDTDINGTTAKSLNIKYSYYAQSFFSYNEETQQYEKGQYNASHIDANNDMPLSFKNILILGSSYSLIQGDDKNRLDLYFTGEGKGYYITNGVSKNIVWKKSDRQTPYCLYEEDGTTPLMLNPGKSYIGITDGLSCVTLSDTQN